MAFALLAAGCLPAFEGRHETLSDACDPAYHLYDHQSLLLATRSYRTCGPVLHRRSSSASR